MKNAGATPDGLGSGSDSASGSASGEGGSPDAGSCPTSQFQWAISGGGPQDLDLVSGIDVDKSGNVWVTGTFTASATWGSVQLTSAEQTSTTGFVAKLDPTGKVLFARAIGGALGGTSFGSRLRVDGNGDAWVVGGYEKQLDIDGVHLVEDNDGNGSVFVLKFDGATGTAEWGDGTSGDGDGEDARDVAIDSNGDVYVVGEYNGTTTLGALTTAGISQDSGVFVAKYSTSLGAWAWLQGWAGRANHTIDGGVPTGVTVSSDGDVYVTGIVKETLNVEGTVLDDDQGGFLVKLASSDGHLVWATALAPDASDEVTPNAVALDASGGVYVTGKYDGMPTFQVATQGGLDAGSDGGAGGVRVGTLSGGTDMFLVKYDTNGNPQWVEHGGSTPNPATAMGADLASDGTSIYVTGFVQNPSAFGSKSLSGTGTTFVAKYDAAGDIQWLQGTDSGSASSGNGYAVVAPTPTSGVFVGGSYAGMQTLGSTTLTSAGESDAFVARMCN